MKKLFYFPFNYIVKLYQDSNRCRDERKDDLSFQT